MVRQVAWAQVALDDLDAAASFIARDSPRYASSFVSEALEAARSLDPFAERGRCVPEFDDPSMREIVLYSYRLVYQVSPNSVLILGLIHCARDFRTAWRGHAEAGTS